MNYSEDNNPFADPSIRQATSSAFTNQHASSDYNPFSNVTTPARPDPPPKATSYAPILPTPPPPVQAQSTPYQPPSYASVSTPISVQQPTERYGQDTKPTATRIDVSQYERQQSELDEREKRLAERERALQNSAAAKNRLNNFPPLPKICPCRPCFYQDIGIEIPPQFQLWVRYLYYLWLIYSVTLFLNVIGALSYFVVDKGGAATFGLSLVYLILFVPASYIGWFRPAYRAFREDSAASFMIFFLFFFIQLVIAVLQFLGVANLGCGLILMFELFAAGGKKVVVGLLVMIVALGFAMTAAAGGLLMAKVHRLYRLSGASLEQAQREFQTAFVNNPTVRGAAREVATAGINEAIQGNSGKR